MARYMTANDILNRVVLEVGLEEDTDPMASQNTIFTQLRGLLNSCGQELVELHEWEALVMEYRKVFVDGDSATQDLPGDFAYFINQTGWDHSNDFPVGGPLTAQTWTYVKGRDLVNQTIYASFRIFDGKYHIFPDPPPAGLDLQFNYISRDWVQEQGTTDRRDTVQTGSDIVLYEPILMIKFLKVKHLEAKGFDASSARLEFENMFGARAGRDKGATILSASNSGRGFPYLTPYRNTGDTGFGVP